MDKWVAWPSLPHDALGNYYYPSFPSLGFIVPYVWFKASGIEPSLRSLMFFNFFWHFVATILLTFTTGHLARRFSISSGRTILAQILVAATYLLCYECLFTHGPVYWCQSLNEITLILLILFTAFMFDQPRKGFLFPILLLCFLSPLIEWTGYVADAGFGLAFLWRGWKTRSGVLLFCGLGCWASAGFALSFDILQLISVLGFHEVVDYLVSRMSVRSALGVPFHLYLEGIFKSFALLPVVAALAAYCLYRTTFRLPPWFYLLIIASTSPIMENIVVLEHATFYFFDRTKIILPIILLSAGWMFITRYPKTVTMLWGFAIISNIVLLFAIPKTIDVSTVTGVEKRLWSKIGEYNRPCSIVAASGTIRGYYDTLTNRSIYEDVPSVDEMKKLVKERGACTGIWMTSSFVPQSWWDRAYVYDSRSDKITLFAEK
jgi:hypothetical protein